MAREDVIKLIDENGGPEGLDLSGFDLAGVDLKSLELQGIVFGRLPFSGPGKGANLEGARFEDSDLTRANLAQMNLRGAGFWQSTLCEASLWAADAQNARFGKVDLSRADLYGCDLSGANLWYARLEDANLGVANLANAVMTGVELGDSILQERPEAFARYFDRWYVEALPVEYKAQHLASRHGEAAEIYMNLKNAHLSHGRYKEASWAYIKERRMDRTTHHPKRARSYYGDDLPHTAFSWRWWRFYGENTLKWLLDWAAELSCGYGERPLRTVAWADVMLFVFPFLYAWSGGIESTAGPLSWLDYFNYSLGAFTTIGFAQFDAVTPLTQTLTSLEALLGISILALLMFALGNRISRS